MWGRAVTSHHFPTAYEASESVVSRSPLVFAQVIVYAGLMTQGVEESKKRQLCIA